MLNHLLFVSSTLKVKHFSKFSTIELFGHFFVILYVLEKRSLPFSFSLRALLHNSLYPPEVKQEMGVNRTPKVITPGDQKKSVAQGKKIPGLSETGG